MAVYLDIGFGLVSDFHDEFSLSIYHMLKDALVNTAGRQS